MKAQTLLAIAITALGLAACGSSGGGSPIDNGRNSPNPNSPINPNDPNPGGGNPPPPPANQRTGKAITLSSNGYQRISEQALSFTQQNFGVLKVDGQELNIIPPNMSAGGLLNMQARNTARVGQVMTQSSYGYVREGTNAQGYMFSQGIVTSANDMPTSGTFNYSGYAVHAPVSNQTNAQIATGAANFNVNFGNHTISGRLSPANNAEVVLDNGIINGNSFSGTANSGAKFSGHFYGGHADEMGGTYQKSGEYTGAFGTQKIVP